MGDNNSKEAVVKQVVEDERAKETSEKQNSPGPVPKLLGLLKLGNDDKDKGNLDEYLHDQYIETDSEPEIIEIDALETDSLQPETANSEKDRSEFENLSLESANTENEESEIEESIEEEIGIEKSESMTLLLQTRRQSEFRNSVVKPKLAEILKDKNWSEEWKFASQASLGNFESESSSPKLLELVTSDDLKAKLAFIAKTRNSNQLSAASENSGSQKQDTEKHQEDEATRENGISNENILLNKTGIPHIH